MCLQFDIMPGTHWLDGFISFCIASRISCALLIIIVNSNLSNSRKCSKFRSEELERSIYDLSIKNKALKLEIDVFNLFFHFSSSSSCIQWAMTDMKEFSCLADVCIAVACSLYVSFFFFVCFIQRVVLFSNAIFCFNSFFVILCTKPCRVVMHQNHDTVTVA